MSSHPSNESKKGENYLNYDTSVWSWITTVDHKRIGLMYLVALLVFFFVGGIAALIVRTELAYPGGQILTPQQYNWLFTVHGVVMIFLFIVPGIPAVLGNFMLPLMIGAKDVVFPKLNLLSFYVYMAGAAMAFVSVLQGIDTGWTFYAPYSIQTPTSVILIVGAAFVLGFSSILTGLNFIVTIHKLRAPGLTWMRLPVFVWGLYATSVIQTVATPVVGMTLMLLIFERAFGVGVFDPTKGGDPVLFEHLFWFYSHPVVYIMVLPAFGIIGEIIPVFSRKPLFGYRMVVLSSVLIAAVGFIVWAHHMFTSSQSDFSATLFSVLTFLVAIPTAIKVFNWVSTMYKGSISFSTPMLYAMAFVFLFMIAGTTGVYLAALAADIYLHDTYFVVAHFHYTIQGGAVIGLVAGLHYWFPKITGKMYNELSAKLGWLIIMIGFNLTFLPQFILGLNGFPRRYYNYLEQFSDLHFLSSVGAFINAFGYSFAFLNLLFAWMFSKKLAPANPYNALGLEWQAASPPIHENFVDIPVVDFEPYAYATEHVTA
jgi:cytochrome c oxidase subunit I